MTSRKRPFGRFEPLPHKTVRSDPKRPFRRRGPRPRDCHNLGSGRLSPAIATRSSSATATAARCRDAARTPICTTITSPPALGGRLQRSLQPHLGMCLASSARAARRTCTRDWPSARRDRLGTWTVGRQAAAAAISRRCLRARRRSFVTSMPLDSSLVGHDADSRPHRPAVSCTNGRPHRPAVSRTSGDQCSPCFSASSPCFSGASACSPGFLVYFSGSARNVAISSALQK